MRMSFDMEDHKCPGAISETLGAKTDFNATQSPILSSHGATIFKHGANHLSTTNVCSHDDINGATTLAHGATIESNIVDDSCIAQPPFPSRLQASLGTVHQPVEIMYYEVSTLSSSQSFSTLPAPFEDQPWSITTLAHEDRIDYGYWDSDDEDYPTVTLAEAISQEPFEFDASLSKISVGENDQLCIIQQPSSLKCADVFHPSDKMVNDCPIVEDVAFHDVDFLGVEFFLSKYEEWMPHEFLFDVKQACNFARELIHTPVWLTVHLGCTKTTQHLPLTASQMALATLAFHGVLSFSLGDIFPFPLTFHLVCYFHVVLFVSYLLFALQWQDPP